MKRVSLIFTIVLAMAMLSCVPAFAEEYTSDTVSGTVEVAEVETSIIEADSELTGLLDSATPEQIETVKQYILYGVNALPVPDRVRLYVESNLDSIAWILAAVAFVLFFIGNRMSNNKLSVAASTMTDNAVECVDKAQTVFDAAAQEIKDNREAVDKAVSEMLTAVKNSAETTLTEAKESMEAMLAQSNKTATAATQAISALTARESGLMEAEKMMAQVLSDLLQVSSLPEWKRDEFSVHLKDALAKIEEVTANEHADDE